MSDRSMSSPPVTLPVRHVVTLDGESCQPDHGGHGASNQVDADSWHIGLQMEIEWCDSGHAEDCRCQARQPPRLGSSCSAQQSGPVRAI